MVDMSGIPRGFDVGAMRRELAELKRKVDLLESRRNYVALDRIVEGGTIDAGVGDKLTETVQEKIVVNGDNLAVDALDGRVITGSTVQTDPEPEVGSKMTNGGVTVHGKAVVGEPTTGSAPETKMRAVLDSRPTKWSGGPDDKWPGLWLESTPPSGATPPLFPPGVTVGASNGAGLVLQSSNDGAMTPNGEIAIGRGSIQITARPVTGGNLFGEESGLGLGYGTFGLGAKDASGAESAYVSNEQSDGVLRIYGRNGVDIEGDLTINGEPYTPGSGGGGPLEPDEDGVLRLHGTNGVNVTAPNGPLKLDSTTGVNITGPVTINGQPYSPGVTPGPWLDLPLINGWRITNNLKMRPSYRVTGDIVEFRGSISGGTSNIICQMPAAIRALKEENKVVPQYNTGWVNGTISVAPDGFIRLDTYASNVYSVNLDFSYSRSA